MRPRFALEVDCEAEELMEVIRERLQKEEHPITGSSARRHAVLKMPSEKRRFWTPQLDLKIEEHDGDVTLRAIFSPHPHVWTGFVFTYAMLFMLGLCGVMYGLAELSLGRTPWGLLAPVVTSVIAAFVYGAAFIGQGLGAAEMYRLRTFLDDCLEDAAERSRATPRTARDSAAL